MNKSDWSKMIDTQAAHRRAGGRNRYNQQRQANAFIRSLIAIVSYDHLGMTPAEIAQREGVHLTTVYRDIWRHRGKLRPWQAKRRAIFEQALQRFNKKWGK